MAAAPQETPAENIRKRVEALTNTPTEAELAALKQECQKLKPEEQEDLQQQLGKAKEAAETMLESDREKKLIRLGVITALLEQLAAPAAPSETPEPAAATEAPQPAPPQKKEGPSASVDTEPTFARAAGKTVEKGLTGAAYGVGVATEKTVEFMGDATKGYVGIVGNLKHMLEREKQFCANSNRGDKLLRYSGAVLIIGVVCYLAKKLWGKAGVDKEGKPTKPGFFRRALTVLGITALAGWTLQKLGPTAERQRALAEGAAEAAPAGAPSSAPAQAEAPETVLSPADIAKQLPEGTNLKAAEREITLNGEQMKFQITDTGIRLNGTTYKVSTETPAHWVNVLDTNLQPQITKATWQRGGIELDAKVNYKERAGFFDGTPVDGMTEYKNVLIPFEKIPAFFAQAKTGKPFKYSHEIALGGWVQKDFSFETTGTTS